MTIWEESRSQRSKTHLSVVICTFPVLFPHLAYLDNGGKQFLQSIVVCLPNYTVPHPKEP